MGITGRAVISRLLGIILAALAVQFIIDGITALIG
jgi:multiple antibiotic resistance protein